MSVFRRGKTYWYEFVFNGQRIRESTKSTSKTLAERAERKRHTELEEAVNNVRSKKQRHKLFSTAAKDWLATNKARWSESYTDMQGYNLVHLNSYFGKKLLNDITAESIAKYQAKRKAESYGEPPKKTSNRTINMEVSTLRMILKSHKLWRGIEDDGVKMLPERKRVGKALTSEQAKKLLTACRNSLQPSLYTAVMIFCNTALRNAELRCALWHQVDFLLAEFQVGEAKTEGSTGRVVPLNKAALDAFTSWKARWPNAKPEDYIFPSEKLVFKGKGAATRRMMTSYGTDLSKPLGSWKTAWRTAKKEAGVKARIHDLRHHANTVMVESGTPIQTLKSITGHLTDEMVEHYTHIRDEARRRAVESLNSAYVQ